jgi:hypothetical protein
LTIPVSVQVLKLEPLPVEGGGELLGKGAFEPETRCLCTARARCRDNVGLGLKRVSPFEAFDNAAVEALFRHGTPRLDRVVSSPLALLALALLALVPAAPAGGVEESEADRREDWVPDWDSSPPALELRLWDVIMVCGWALRQ